MTGNLFLETANQIGRRLCRDAIWADDRCNWMGWAMEPLDGTWSLAYKAQPAALYDGTAGIALFLARLYQFTQDPLQKTTLIGAVNRSLAALPSLDPMLSLSLMNGTVGIAYMCLEVGALLEDEELVRRGMATLAKLASVEPHETMVDICAGSAGAIPVLLNAAAQDSSGRFTETAVKHGQHLVRTAVRSDEGWSWATTPGQKNLLGYAHGTAGIACALLELWSATGEREFRNAALEAFRYERTYFDSVRSNWPDFRIMEPFIPTGSQSQFMSAWCHGAPGVGLSRLRAYELLKPDSDVELAKELEASVNTTVQSLASGQGSYCLCHGAAGNAELFVIAGRLLARQDYKQAAESVGQNGIALYGTPENPWPCGVMGAGETPNLMLGLAGIGHFYLRLHDPENVPSVLLLTPAKARAL